MTFNTELWNGQAPGAGGYQIQRSLRFNSADSAFLNRTPASAGNRKTWTWAGWVKTTATSGTQALFGTPSGSVEALDFSGSAFRYYTIGGSGALLTTSAVFRDPSAWLHVVLAVDTTQAVDTNRVKLYVNGSQITQFSSSTYPAQNYDTYFNNNNAIYIGDRGVGVQALNAYLADIHFIDGQALDPTSFGEFDDNGIWQPIEYTGSYPGNSFHLDFSDNSSAAALGTDTSGNGNTWTVNNISVSPGAGNDSLVDVPTNGTETDTGVGGEVRGNYCTWDPLNFISNYAHPENGNLQAVFDVAAGCTIAGNFYVSSGKWYWEVVMTVKPAGYYPIVGVVKSGYDFSATAGSSYLEASPLGYVYGADGHKGNNGSTSVYGASFAQGDILGFALDLDAGTITAYKNGVSQGVMYSGLSGSFAPAVSSYNMGGTNRYDINCGQRPFAYTAPSGFNALCTANLPSTTITTSGSYTGNGVADGPFVYLNGVPTAMTVGGNSVTFGTDADKLSNGFKIRTTSTTYNQNASTYNYSITSTGDPFKTARAQSNP